MDREAALGGRWHYSSPARGPVTDGETVLFARFSVAPAEVFEWGLDGEKRPFKRYRWCEDGFFEESSFEEAIPDAELLARVRETAGLLAEEGMDSLAAEYRALLAWLIPILEENGDGSRPDGVRQADTEEEETS